MNTKTYTSERVEREAKEAFARNVEAQAAAMYRNAAPTVAHTLPLESQARKDVPLYSGVLRYFPAALAEVARVSKLGNDKHNPGQPLHHARGKSSDHADCILRHLMDFADRGDGTGRDAQGVPHVAYIAWRALALAQAWLEANDAAPLAPGARLPSGLGDVLKEHYDGYYVRTVTPANADVKDNIVAHDRASVFSDFVDASDLMRGR